MSGSSSELLSEICSLQFPTDEIFWKIARLRHEQIPCSRLEKALEAAAWLEAAHQLLALSHPAQGYMGGLLPDGTAHVRLMLSRPNGYRPIDVMREDGELSLAFLEAIVLALEATDNTARRLAN